tara:strand:+ start:201 stop:611 length:411 start_codon:yes stop_codon:yes gene_type:complete
MNKKIAKILGYFIGVTILCSVSLIVCLSLSYDEAIRVLTKSEVKSINVDESIVRTHPVIPILYYANTTLPNRNLLQASDTKVTVKSKPEQFNIAEVIVIQKGYLDDSLIYQRFEATLYKHEEQWFVHEVSIISRTR